MINVEQNNNIQNANPPISPLGYLADGLRALVNLIVEFISFLFSPFSISPAAELPKLTLEDLPPIIPITIFRKKPTSSEGNSNSDVIAMFGAMALGTAAISYLAYSYLTKSPVPLEKENTQLPSPPIHDSFPEIFPIEYPVPESAKLPNPADGVKYLFERGAAALDQVKNSETVAKAKEVSTQYGKDLLQKGTATLNQIKNSELLAKAEKVSKDLGYLAQLHKFLLGSALAGVKLRSDYNSLHQ